MSLYGMMRTGVSGMNAQSTRLATVADNIANSGTNGYKKASVEFSSLVVPNTGSNYVSGGVSTQVRYNMNAGNIQYTTSVTDLAIDGNGFFVVQDAAGKPFLTRAGSFIPDGNGNLINAAGYYLMGRSFELGVPGATTAFGDYEKVTIPVAGLERVPSTYGALASNLPFEAPVYAGALPSSNPATDIQIKQGMENGSIFKSGLTAIGNAGQPIRLDIYFTRTAAAGEVYPSPNNDYVSYYGGGPLPVPDGAVFHANYPNVASYSPPNTVVPDGTGNNFSYGGFTGLGWSTGDTVAFNIDIDGASVFVLGEFDGATWTFAPEALPPGVTLSFDTTGPDLVFTIDNATGSAINTDIAGLGAWTANGDRNFHFENFTLLDWEEGDAVSFNVDIDGASVDVTGIFSGGSWTFAPDDPAAIPADVTITYDTSGPDLVVNVYNQTGANVGASFGNFTATATATTDKWEVTVFHQPDATVLSAFPYSNAPLNTITLEFDPTTGSLDTSSLGSMALDLTALNGLEVEIDLSDMRQLAAGYTPLAAEMNGSGPSAIDRIAVDDDGVVSVQYANGAMKQLYRLDLAFVQSPDQLTVLPGNVFSEGLESGQVNFGKPNEISLGAVKSGALESSNVDIAEELTNMIESQRNYTANSKVFQTGSDLMDVLVNLKR